MLSVLLLILKIIGWILLAIILLIALILIVPIRYQFILNKLDNEDPYIKVKISWFLILFHARMEYAQYQLTYGGKIFWKQIFGNSEEYLRKKDEKERQKEEKKDKKKKKNTKKELPAKIEELAEPEEMKKPEIKEAESGEAVQKKVNKDDVNKQEEKKDKKTEKKKARIKKEKKDKKSKKDKAKESTSKNPFDKLKEMKTNLQEKADEYHLKENIAWGKKVLYKILKHLLPRKMKGFARYGFENPATTGYITAVAAIFYPKYAKTLKVYPEFSQSILEAELSGKGKIRLGYLIYIAIIIILNKDVRKLIFH